MPRRQPSRHSRRAISASAALLAPDRTVMDYRRQHDTVRLLPEQIADASGGIGQPFRAVDTLEAMEAAGTITEDMRRAGEQFRDDFAVAGLDALQAAKLDRAGMGTMSHGPYRGATIGQAAEVAKDRVWAQIRAAGGIGNDGGECLWYVLGWQYSLRRWSQERTLAGRRTSPGEAAGILRAALGVLAGEKSS